MRIVPLMSCRHLIPSWVRQELERVVHALLPHHSLADGMCSDETCLAPPRNRKDNPPLSSSSLLSPLQTGALGSPATESNSSKAKTRRPVPGIAKTLREFLESLRSRLRSISPGNIWLVPVRPIMLPLAKCLCRLKGLILAELHLVIAPIANLAALLLSALTKAARLASSWVGSFRPPLLRSLSSNRASWPVRPTASTFIPLRL